VKRGETEYGIGAIPLGGMVKITGMDPRVELPEDVKPRAYYAQPVWKRIVVISAGPAMNLLLAFVILWALFLVNGTATTTKTIDAKGLQPPATSVLRPGDRVVSVDGKGGSPEAIALAVAKHRCPGQPTNGCQAATPASVTVIRDGGVRATRSALTLGRAAIVGLIRGVTVGLMVGVRAPTLRLGVRMMPCA